MPAGRTTYYSLTNFILLVVRVFKQKILKHILINALAVLFTMKIGTISFAE
jgi:hypothetical protein